MSLADNDYLYRFRAAMREAGIETEAAIQADGLLHRFRVAGDKAATYNGWYVLYLEGLNAGVFGCWKRGVSETWYAKPPIPMTDSERQALNERIEDSKRERGAEQARKHAECKSNAKRLWSEAGEHVSADHPYLIAKGVQAYGLRQLRDDLLVPVRSDDGELVGLQFIHPDGTKRFLTGTSKVGSYHRIASVGSDLSRVLICEGYATGASLNEASGCAVAIAFDAGNLLAVTKILYEKLPDAELVLCADDDRSTASNPGVTKATAAARAAGCLLAVPTFPLGAEGSDFNDLHQLAGLDAVRMALEMAFSPNEQHGHDEQDHVVDASNITARGDVAAVDDVLEAEEAMIARLAGLNDLAYIRARDGSAKALGIKSSDLDKLIAKERKRQHADEVAPSDGGSSVLFSEVKLWPVPVDGAVLLDHMTSTIQRFTVLSIEQARACALWSAFTWFIDGANIAPLLNVSSPEPRCGKSTLGELIKEMVARPLYASNITPAALFRSVEMWKPTLMIDEADSFLNEKEELRGIINAGHYRSTAYVIRVVGDALEPKQFCTWGAKALIGIGKIAHTLADRSVLIELRRKLESERVEKVRHAEADLFLNIRRKLARWADDELGNYKALKPKPIEAIHDRAADNWEPLLMVAMIADGEWPARCISTALALSGAAQEGVSINAELLADIKAAFERKRASKMFTTRLLEALCEDSEAPWATWSHGRQMTARQLSSRLSSFGVTSGTTRIGTETAKGYTLERFVDAFARYLPDTGR
ncbi:MAG: DUF3631 domain-containing protein [Pseudomonadota bacterium]